MNTLDQYDGQYTVALDIEAMMNLFERLMNNDSGFPSYSYIIQFYSEMISEPDFK